MKILLLAPQPFYQERGTPIAVRLLARTLAEQGHVVHLLVFAEGEEITIPGVTIHRPRRFPGLQGVKPGLSAKKLICDVFFFFKCIQLVRRYSFDLVHAVEEAVFMAMVVKKLYKIPYVYDMDSSMSLQVVDKFPSLKLVRRLMEALEHRAIAGSSGVLAVCQALEEIVHQAAPGKLTVRLEDITLLEDTGTGEEDLRQTLNLQGAIVMYVGNLEQYQGIDLLLEGFALALEQNEALSLVLIGGRQEDIDHYQEQAEKREIASQVFFCGQRPVSLLGYYLGQADILVSPRTQGNNTPMKIYSYLDSGVPLLATDLPTHTQVLDREIACLVDPSPRALAEGLVSLAADSELRQRLAHQAGQRVEQEYSLPAFQRKLASFYQQLNS